MKEYIEKIYRELALVEDEKKRLEQRSRVENLLAKYDGPDKVVDYSEYLQKVDLERQNEGTRHKTNIHTLDEKTEGFKGGDLVVISAPTGTGKTTFAQTIMQNMTTKSLFLSYEVRPEEMAWDEGFEFSLPLDLKGDTMEWIEKKIIEAKVKTDAKMVFIDHLHYISDVMKVGKGQNQSTVIGVTMSKLAQMAKKWDVVIFLIAHLKKTKFDEMPDMSDLRDSSFIAQYADIVIMLLREMKEVDMGEHTYKALDDITIANVLKCRGVGRTTGLFKMKFENNKLYEVDA